MRKLLCVATAIVLSQSFHSCSTADAKERIGSEDYNDYIVVSGESNRDLESKVKDNLSLYKYKLVGGVFVSNNGVFYQAMAR